MVTREITFIENAKFSIGKEKNKYDFSGVSALRKVLSNEKIKILNHIKINKPSSIYEISRQLNRNFKSVYEDLSLLKRFGFIDIIKQKKNNRTCHKPILISNKITVHIHL